MTLIAIIIAVVATATAIGFTIDYVLTSDFRAGRRAFGEGEWLNAEWSASKRDGWSTAWGEQLRDKLGQRQ